MLFRVELAMILSTGYGIAVITEHLRPKLWLIIPIVNPVFLLRE
jgi:hypothetical protein